jgi:hypothetical protein
LTLLEQSSSLTLFDSMVRVPRPLFFGLMFCRSLFVLLSFSCCHCIVCSSSISGFWLPLWYLQTLLTDETQYKMEIRFLDIVNDTNCDVDWKEMFHVGNGPWWTYCFYMWIHSIYLNDIRRISVTKNSQLQHHHV